ncbi:bifunctional methylenetetrahydrofolate dehydrogenase/methenyltetrahydrofolate cyclohydrolase FolD [Paucidesulfovibrio longus]|uniref:bifunctional methylenetetrahydrofolate dehydrogenase/methenyltetrahydrofolate cyclohydrolase FolD n=1 Tax=Paucidesulfovibrio longus TaxID=889 RepID=UPI0003B375CE|nr:bifunctional methylenetetrahydrofolate dehydrogenase/methenyltetrahydrofolate cyclohydrolase FolD [Paucidesulfovibrio longus]
MTTILDGKKTSATIRAEVAAEVAELTAQQGRAPGLTVILVGEDPGSQVYVRNKERACAEAGIVSVAHRLPASTTQAELEALVDALNADDSVDGILLQLPLPQGLDSQKLLDRIDPDKDVDGFHPVSVGRLALGLPGFRSCTPAGVIELLDRHGIDPSGKRAVIVGRSNIVGKPLALLLMQGWKGGNATVTVCHTRTPDLKKECLDADILVAAVGRPRMISGDMVREGAVVVDVGINRTEEGLCGDVDFESAKEKAAAITPVPGGVGPMTIAMLLKNTLRAYKLHQGLEAW